jgi:DNA-binding transcriptional ArsR family regulator
MFQRIAIAESDIYHLLSNPRRRETLTVLLRRSNEITLRDLSEEIAATEAGVTPAPRPLKQSVYNALHQTHLPKLDEFGLVTYDADRKIVRPCRQMRYVNRYMDTVTRFGITWGEYYRALGIGGLFAVVASLADLPGFGAVDPLVFASGSLGLFALSACYQLTSGPRRLFASLTAKFR